jgi:hypothetical protein
LKVFLLKDQKFFALYRGSTVHALPHKTTNIKFILNFAAHRTNWRYPSILFPRSNQTSTKYSTPEAPQYVFSIHVAFQLTIVYLYAPPFVYRYLLVCHGMTPTKKKIFLIYILFLIPIFANIPMHTYLKIWKGIVGAFAAKFDCLSGRSVYYRLQDGAYSRSGEFVWKFWVNLKYRNQGISFKFCK